MRIRTTSEKLPDPLPAAGSGSFSPAEAVDACETCCDGDYGRAFESHCEKVPDPFPSTDAKGSGTFSGKLPPEKEPDPYLFRGLPRRRSVLSWQSSASACCCQSASPNGVPRLTDSRRRNNSACDSARVTNSSQGKCRRIGPSTSHESNEGVWLSTSAGSGAFSRSAADDACEFRGVGVWGAPFD